MQDYTVWLPLHLRTVTGIDIMLFREDNTTITPHKHARPASIALYDFIINHSAFGINIKPPFQLVAAVPPRLLRPTDFPVHHVLLPVNPEEHLTMMETHAIKILPAAFFDTVNRRFVVHHAADNGLQKAYAMRMGGQTRHLVLREHIRPHTVEIRLGVEMVSTIAAPFSAASSAAYTSLSSIFFASCAKQPCGSPSRASKMPCRHSTEGMKKPPMLS